MAWSASHLERLWVQNGGDPSKARIAAAVALAESSGNAYAKSANPVSGGQNRGFWQIDSGSHADASFNPDANVRAAIRISRNGRDWGAWETYTNGAYRKFLGQTSAPSLAGGTPAGGLGPAAPVPSPGSAVGVATPGTTALPDLLAQLRQQETRPTITAPTPPASIGRYLNDPRPKVGSTPAAQPVTPAGSSLASQLAQAAGLAGPTVPQATGGLPTGGGGGGASGGGGKIARFEGVPVAAWMVPDLQYARQHGWTGKITSGVRTYQQQAALYANRGNNPNPVARPGTSNHEIENGGAVDVTNPDQLAQILARDPRSQLRRDPSIRDPVHFSRTGR